MKSSSSEILINVDKIKKEIIAICSLEISKNRFDPKKAEALTEKFSKIINRYYFIESIAEEESDSLELRLIKRKMRNTVKLFADGDWSNFRMIHLVELTFINIFTDTLALRLVAEKIKKLYVYSIELNTCDYSK